MFIFMKFSLFVFDLFIFNLLVDGFVIETDFDVFLVFYYGIRVCLER